MKRYEQPKTPYQRLLESPSVDRRVKQRLKAEYNDLNPAQLKIEITRLQQMLCKVARNKRRKLGAA